ncbi:MAG: flagellar basal body rod protein FlgB [Magnetospirillum sp.]|nr:flagellar basal body rod protein FlgB [Magnetospirillum sp.]
MFDKIDVLAMATKKMDWLAERQEVLAENIANSDTPKYTPRDLKPLDFKSVLQETGQPAVLPVATNPRHIVPQMTDPNVVQTEKKAYESSPDGNAVVLEEQMSKVGEDRAAYEVASTLFQKQVSLLKLVTIEH